MKTHKNKEASATVRRSLVLSKRLVEEACLYAPLPLRRNFNRLVIFALEMLTQNEKQKKFEQEIANMASDPQILSVCETIGEEFALTEADGLKRD